MIRRATKTDALLAHIRGLGTDKYGASVGIRTTALTEATGVGANSIQVLLDPAVLRGDLVVCKITGPGVPPPDFVPLNVKRAGIALRGAPKPASSGPTPLSTPKPTVDAIRTPTLITKTQPEVVAPAEKTPAAEARPPMRAAPAVAAPATPKPDAGAVLKKEPAARKASAGDVRIGINDSGTLVIALDDDSIELNPKNAKRLGHFMAGTAGVWNPF